MFEIDDYFWFSFINHRGIYFYSILNFGNREIIEIDVFWNTIRLRTIFCFIYNIKTFLTLEIKMANKNRKN